MTLIIQIVTGFAGDLRPLDISERASALSMFYFKTNFAVPEGSRVPAAIFCAIARLHSR
jgi:hypothetical protein